MSGTSVELSACGWFFIHVLRNMERVKKCPVGNRGNHPHVSKQSVIHVLTFSCHVSVLLSDLKQN